VRGGGGEVRVDGRGGRREGGAALGRKLIAHAGRARDSDIPKLSLTSRKLLHENTYLNSERRLASESRRVTGPATTIFTPVSLVSCTSGMLQKIPWLTIE